MDKNATYLGWNYGEGDFRNISSDSRAYLRRLERKKHLKDSTLMLFTVFVVLSLLFVIF